MIEEKEIRTAIYIDFDNIYGNIISTYQIPAKGKISPFQFYLFELLLMNFLKLMKNSKVQTLAKTEFLQNPLCLKAFAEFHNLPHNNMFSPPLTNKLQEIGITVYTPFIPYKSKSNEKGKNAADVALVLSAIEDLIVKRIPVETVIIATCDIDLYPAIRWLKEHTGLPIILATFMNNVNETYKKALRKDEIWPLDSLYIIGSALNEALEDYLKLLKEGHKNPKIKDKDIEYLKSLKSKLDSMNLYLYSSAYLDLITKLLDLLVSKLHDKEDSDTYAKFKEKLHKGLISWLRKGRTAKTGLIISSWLPRWELGIDEATANEYLKRFIEEELPKHPEITFNGEERDGVIIGEFRLNES